MAAAYDPPAVEAAWYDWWQHCVNIFNFFFLKKKVEKNNRNKKRDTSNHPRKTLKKNSLWSFLHLT